MATKEALAIREALAIQALVTSLEALGMATLTLPDGGRDGALAAVERLEAIAAFVRDFVQAQDDEA